MNLLLNLPTDIYMEIYKLVYANVMEELTKVDTDLEWGLYGIPFCTKRCNMRIHGRRCKKMVKTKYLLNNYCAYHSHTGYYLHFCENLRKFP